VLVCWLVLPVKGLFKPSARKLRTDGQKSTSAQVRLYTIIVVGFGVIFTLWARRLGLSWPIVIGTLFFIEALPSVIVSLTEWWRLSTIGFSVGLMICGLGLPFMHGSNLGILFGGAVFLGGLLAAGILYWQLRQHENKA
jgi:hypothetical protein